jgi:hypothetical protein
VVTLVEELHVVEFPQFQLGIVGQAEGNRVITVGSDPDMLFRVPEFVQY